MSHPTVFELKRFVDGAATLSDAEERHVSRCPTCTTSLRRLARRELERQHLVATLPTFEPRVPALAALMAVLAAMLVVTSRPVPLPDAPTAVSAVAPEGIHGVASSDDVLFEPPRALLVDGGARLGSE
jgi:hypothetical protein